MLSERLTLQIRRTDRRCHGQTNDDTSIVIHVFDSLVSGPRLGESLTFELCVGADGDEDREGEERAD